MKKLLLLAFLLTGSVQAQTFLVFGTSIERGAGATHPDSSWVGRLKKAVKPQTVVNMAVSGSTYMDSMSTSMWPALYLAKIQNYNPTYIILGGAFNDSKFNPQVRFQREYRRFLDSIQKFWPNAEIICNTPIKCRNYPTFLANLESVIVPETIEEAYTASVRICNMWMLPNTVAGPDGVHPDNAGHLKMFRSWWGWFQGPIVTKKTPIIEGPVVEIKIGGRTFNKQVLLESY
jgi:lysophospholipase L1-like esterase